LKKAEEARIFEVFKAPEFLMSLRIELPPPDPEDCLITPRVSTHKGGTLVAEDVHDLVGHARRICDPDGYRPAACPRCGHRLHVHCYPERRPRGDARMPPVIRIAQYVCASSACGATWRILPRFLARHLWRTWATVERGVAAATTIPARTVCRWRARLAATARMLVVLLATSGAAVLEGLAARVGLDATRGAVVAAHAEVAGAAVGEQLSTLAALVHRLARGVRLM
jgi:hypothetical protein